MLMLVTTAFLHIKIAALKVERLMQTPRALYSKNNEVSLFLNLPVSLVELADGGVGGGGAKSCDGEKTWSHRVLSDL
jgi:hypothetical protein